MTCGRCNETKTHPSFVKDNRRKSGYRALCRACREVERRADRAANPEPLRQQEREYRHSRPELMKRQIVRSVEWAKANPERAKEIKRRAYLRFLEDPERVAAKRAYAESQKDKKREYDRLYRAQRAEHIGAIKGKWRAENPDKVRDMKSAWKKRNPHIEAAHAMKRIACKKNATPHWLTPAQLDEIKEFYLDAATRPGGPWHVDHIVPLQGKTVRGLHVPWNLRVVLASENISKNNRLLEDLIAA